MKWWLKAVTQAGLARLPYGEALNHRLQIWNGYHRRFHWAVENNVRHLCNVVSSAERFGLGMEGATLVEVGTGWTPTLPIGACLLGAHVHTYDHLPHLREANVRKLVDLYPEFLPQIADRVGARLETLRARHARLQEARQGRMLDWLRAIDLHYHAPGDAAQTRFGVDSVDLYFSIAVLEHVSEQHVRRMVQEARRIVRPGGLTYHHIGLHDHLAESDPKATKINFLKFDDSTWKLLGQNKIQFHNRLRRSEFIRIFEEAGFDILECESEIDNASLQALPTMRLNQKYRSFDERDLATYVMTICCRKSQHHRSSHSSWGLWAPGDSSAARTAANKA